MKKISINKANKKDLKSVLDIDKLVLGSSSRKKILKEAIEKKHCFVAKIMEEIVGFGILNQSFYENSFISLIIVHPDYRRKGVAKELIHFMESICPTSKLFTSANKSNAAARKTYESLGFIESGYIENLDEGDPEIVYFKQVKK